MEKIIKRFQFPLAMLALASWVVLISWLCVDAYMDGGIMEWLKAGLLVPLRRSVFEQLDQALKSD